MLVSDKWKKENVKPYTYFIDLVLLEILNHQNQFNHSFKQSITKCRQRPDWGYIHYGVRKRINGEKHSSLGMHYCMEILNLGKRNYRNAPGKTQKGIFSMKRLGNSPPL